MKEILVISPSEICYHPRLIKAIDFFIAHECNITVYNTITGAAPKDIYLDFFKNRNVNCFENNINKQSINSKFKWFLISSLHLILNLLWGKFGIKFFFPYIHNKGTIGLIRAPKHFDIILINLVDVLPLAVKIKSKQKEPSILVYDSQEFFIGQYAKYDISKLNWVIYAERKYLQFVDMAICTTNVMKEKFYNTYSFKKPLFRVRNIPVENESNQNIIAQSENFLKLIWHGMSINYGNCRGVHILVNAIAFCKTPVKLYLQGKLNNKDRNILSTEINRLGIEDKIIILEPVKPNLIVKSIEQYDIGITGELPEEENQILTSSNKLFEFIKAGLAVIVSDLPGLRETIDEYRIGLFYKPGDFEELAQKIDYLNLNRDQLAIFKLESKNASKNLNWNFDFQQVWKEIIKL